MSRLCPVEDSARGCVPAISGGIAVTPPRSAPVTPPAPVQFDAEGAALRMPRTDFVVGLCVLSGAWALLVLAARVFLGWKWRR
jgi:hypothetical protein